MKYTAESILNEVVFPCSRGTYLLSDRPQLEGVHAALCAKEISYLLNNGALILEMYKRRSFEKHEEGKRLVTDWAESVGLEYELEVDISIGVADVLIYADDVGVFEIGTTRPTKMILLLKFITKENFPFSVHFWPYGTNDAIVFKNWQ